MIESENNQSLESQKEKQELISALLLLRDESSDEIPSFGATAVDQDEYGRDYKVRKNWWNHLLGVIESRLMQSCISLSAKEKVEKFAVKFSGSSGFAHRLTTAEDIAEANKLINTLLDDLRK